MSQGAPAVSTGALWAVVTVAIASFATAHLASPAIGPWIGTGLAAAVTLAVALSAGKAALTDAFIGRPAAAWEILEGVVCGVLMTLATHAAWALVGDLTFFQTEVASLYAVLAWPPGPVLAIPVLLAVVTVEEVAWRGVVTPGLEARFGRACALGFAALLYALPQVVAPSPLLGVVALGCGALWTAQRLWRESIWVPLATHIVWDLGVFVVFPLT